MPTCGDEIVAAAVPIFLRFGYKKASMDAVAAAANLSRQAVYLHFDGKEAVFAAVVERLCESTRQAAHVALWRAGLTLQEQLLTAFDETMPHESMQLLAELLTTAQALVPYAVANVDALVVEEITARLRAASYGVKQQTGDRAEYLAGMQCAIGLVLTAGGLAASRTGARR